MDIINAVQEVIYRHILRNACKVVGIVMTLAIILQVANRYLPLGVTWTEEVSRLSFIWFCFICVAIAYVERAHPCISNLVALFGPKFRRVYDFFPFLAVLCMSIMLSYFGVEMAFMSVSQRSPIMRLSYFWFYMPIPVSFGAISILSSLDIIKMAIGRGVVPIEGTGAEEGKVMD